MNFVNRFVKTLGLGLFILFNASVARSQELPVRYATLELFTNTPCPICGSQNPGLFDRLSNFEGQYHLISFYPGKPYNSCIFYQANIAENTARYQFYTGHIFGTPTVALNGIDFKSSAGVTNMVLDNLTGGTSWLNVKVDETTGTDRTVTINLQDAVGGSLTTGRLFAVIVEKEIQYNAPNGEAVHYNVFRRFLTDVGGELVDMSSGHAEGTFQYQVDGNWNAAETYIIAWLSNPDTKEVYNSGTRFDPDFVSAVKPLQIIPSLSLYPNPASAEVHLTLPNGVTTFTVGLYNAKGDLVRTIHPLAGPEIKITTDNLAVGHYYIRLLTDAQMYTGSFEIVR